MSGEFCDTNILIYAHDSSAPDKREKALSLVARLWSSGTGVVSLQVLQELYVNLTRKVRPPVEPLDARKIVAELGTWRVIEPETNDVIAAIGASIRWQISFWDGLLVVTARKAAAEVLWSEDLNDGQDFDGVTVRNPFS